VDKALAIAVGDVAGKKGCQVARLVEWGGTGGAGPRDTMKLWASPWTEHTPVHAPLTGETDSLEAQTRPSA
jgi:hypothetical protein